MINYEMTFIITATCWLIVILFCTIGLVVCVFGDIVRWIQKVSRIIKDAVRLIAIWFCFITIGLVVCVVGGIVDWIHKVSLGFIRLVIVRDIENGKNDKGTEKEKGHGKEKSGQRKTTLDPFGGGTIERLEAAESDTVSGSRSQSG